MSDAAPAKTESFFRSRWVDPPAGVEELDPARLAPGFEAGAVACGIKESGNTDAAVVVARSERCDSALLLTPNAAAAAPVRLCREACDLGAIRAAAVKSGNANAATGPQGESDAVEMCALAAGGVGCGTEDVLVCSTGLIGHYLPMDALRSGIPALAGMVQRMWLSCGNISLLPPFCFTHSMVYFFAWATFSAQKTPSRTWQPMSPSVPVPNSHHERQLNGCRPS